MTEKKQKRKNKKIATVWEFIRYISFGILVFFLIVALIFQAPWKLTSILIILTAACIALPKAYKKWFWVVAGSIALLLLLWIFLPEKGQWMPYRINLQQELNQLNTKFAIPDEQNAAIIYRKLIEKENLSTEPDLPDFNSHYDALAKPWESRKFPELAMWINKQNKTILALNNASKIEKCYDKIVKQHLVPYPHSLPEHTKSHRRWCYLLICAANNDIAENRIDNAIQKQIALLKISNHLRQQPFTFDFPIGLNLEANALKHINQYLINGKPDQYYLNKIENALKDINHNWKNSWEKIVQLKTLKRKNSLFWILYEKNKNGKIRRTRDQYLAATIGMSLPKNSYWSKKLSKLEAIIYWFFVPSKPQNTEKIINQTLRKYSKMTNFYHQTHKYPRLLSNKPVFNLSYPIKLINHQIVRQYYDAFIRTKSLKKATGIIIALRHYKNQNGDWPQNLAQIKNLLPQNPIDPINNSTYGYKKNATDIILYSKGKNNIDENGTGHFQNTKGEDDWLIWPFKK